MCSKEGIEKGSWCFFGFRTEYVMTRRKNSDPDSNTSIKIDSQVRLNRDKRF
jgi:hypothetical protein